MTSSVADAEKSGMVKRLSEFPCVHNSCGRHSRCLITRKIHQACIDTRKSPSKNKGISNGKSERTVVWTTSYKECAYDYISRRRECIKYKGWLAVAFDAETGDIYYDVDGKRRIYRKQLLSKKREYEAKGSGRNLHILKDNKIAIVDDKASVHVFTKEFQQQPCKFVFTRSGEFWTGVDQKKKVLFYATIGIEYVKFKTLDLKTCTPGPTFQIRGERFIKFVISAGNVFLCSSESLTMVDMTSHRSRKISRTCEKIFLFGDNVCIVLPNFRSIKKFDSSGKFLKKIKMPPRSGQDIAFAHFTTFSLRELRERNN